MPRYTKKELIEFYIKDLENDIACNEREHPGNPAWEDYSNKLRAEIAAIRGAEFLLMHYGVPVPTTLDALSKKPAQPRSDKPD